MFAVEVTPSLKRAYQLATILPDVPVLFMTGYVGNGLLSALVGVPILDAPNGTPTGEETLIASNGTDGFLTVSLVIKL